MTTDTPHPAPAAADMEGAAAARAALLADDAAQAAALMEGAQNTERGTCPLLALGMRGNMFYYYNRKRGRIYELPAREHTRLPLLMLATLADYAAWLEPDMPPEDAPKHERAILNTAARLLLEMTAGRAYDETATRARGIWRDDTPAAPTRAGEQPPPRGFIYNAGNATYYTPGDGTTPPARIDPVRGRHIYTAGTPLPPPALLPLSAVEGRALVDFLSARTWSFPHAGHLLAGWLVNALMAGAMKYRGHIWVNAPRNTGKTYLRDNLLDLLGSFAYFADGAVSTPAAMRAGLDGSPLPVVADEQDPTAGDTRAAANMEKKLELARIASKGGKISLGTTGGGTRDYWLLSCFLFLSIDNALDRDSDLTRWATLRLAPAPAAALQPLRIRQAAALHTMSERDTIPGAGGSFIARLLTRLLMEGNAILRNARILEKALTTAGAETRAAEMFSLWLAGAHALTHGGTMAETHLAAAMEIWQAYNGADETEDEFARCVDTLRAAPVQFNGARLSVSVLCSKHATMADGETREAVRAALLSIGISFTRAGEIALQATAAYLRPLFRGTEYEKRAAAVLSAGCTTARPVNAHGVRMSTIRPGGGSPRRAIILPAALLYTPSVDIDA